MSCIEIGTVDNSMGRKPIRNLFHNHIFIGDAPGEMNFLYNPNIFNIAKSSEVLASIIDFTNSKSYADRK